MLSQDCKTAVSSCIFKENGADWDTQVGYMPSFIQE